jgi:hypothetical protein
METRREASASALPLQGAVHLETSYISTNDRFAAQIVYAAGRYPPIFRLPSTDSFLLFQFLGFENRICLLRIV